MERREAGPDRWLLLTAVALVFLGVFIVFDASYARAAQSQFTGKDPFFYLKRQAMWAGLAVIFLWAASALPYWRLRRWWMPAITAAIGLLVVVLVVGAEINGSKRWIDLGPVSFQPSEFAKLAVVLCLASYSDLWRDRIRHFTRGFIPAAVLLGVVAGLVALEDLGTAISLGVTGILMLYMAGARRGHLALLIVGAMALATVAVMVEPYRMDRFRAWWDPWRYYDGPGYQPVHGLLALGSGGVFGNGLARGTQKYQYLPAEHTDYILATIGEELGLVGCVALILAFVALVVRGLTVAHRSQDWFGSLLAAGLTAMLGVQAALNVAVVTCFVPATGVPLPFISYGGSSLVFTTIAVGIILSVSQHSAGRRAAAQRPSRNPGFARRVGTWG